MKHIIKIGLCMLAVSLLSACEYEPSEDPESSDGSGNTAADFIVQNNHLITIESTLIKVYSLTDSSQPVLEQTYSSTDGFELETIYEYKTNMLMIGTREGTYFKDHSAAGTLTDVSFSEIITSCDPVVTSGNYMYITIQSGQTCSDINNTQGANQLLVYNILQVTQPVLVKTIDIVKPYGLGINGTNLFICYDEGILEFDISDPTEPDQTGDYSQQCNDIIATENPMVLTDDSGVRLVEYANPGLTELSIIRKGE